MSFWQDKNVLVTGATGFVGNHLFKKLNDLGAKTFGISRNGDNKSIKKIDILNFSDLESFVKENKIEICFHLAGESLVEKGQADPYRTFKSNIEGTLNVLEIARKNNLEKVVIASSSHVYGINELPYLEDYPSRPSRPYETSKACTDLIAQSYSISFNLPVLIPRFVNIYGPGDLNFQRLIPGTIKSVLENSSPRMWGGGVIRDYLYIDDAIEAYILLGEISMSKIGSNRIFNFGGSNLINVEDLIKKIIKISGKNFKINKIKNERKKEITSQYVSYEKATKILGWSPKISLDEGLKRTVVWYTKFLYNKS